MIASHYTRVTITTLPGEAQKTTRLDKFMASLWPAYSRVAHQGLINDGQVMIDQTICQRPSQLVSAGQVLAVNFSSLAQTVQSSCVAEPIPLTVLHEDNDILVINKSAGLVVHPGHGNRLGTLQSGLLYHYPETAPLPRCGLVHRLDKDTSGLLVVAKTDCARQHLIEQFKTRQINRDYLAIVHGNPVATSIINLPIGRRQHDPLRMGVRVAGKEAITHFAVEKRWPGFALLRCSLETGRTHQIRVHLEHSGHPIVGDALYHRHARQHTLTADRQLLHATCLRLIHPSSGELCQWHCPPAEDMQTVIAQLDHLNAT